MFLDTEFTDFVACDLISIGLKAETGEEFYGENLDFNGNLSSDFVRDNIYPLLNPEVHGKKRVELSARLWQWLDELPCDKVEIYTDYGTDWSLMFGLLEDHHPKLMGPVDIFSKLGAQCLVTSALSGPDGFSRAFEQLRKKFYEEFLNHFMETKEIQHHALSDARANLRGYLAAERALGVLPY